MMYARLVTSAEIDKDAFGAAVACKNESEK